MRRIGAFAAFFALLAAGCTSADGSDPSTAPLTTPTTSVSTAPPPTSSSTPAAPTVPADVPRTGPNTKPGEQPPVMPVAATAHTADGAKAFAEFFVRTIDWGYATTSSAYMRHYFEPTCEGCAIFADAIDKARGLKHRFEGGRFTVRSGDIVGATATVNADNSAFKELDKRGQPVRADVAHMGEKFILGLEWAAGRWLVASQEIEA